MENKTKTEKSKHNNRTEKKMFDSTKGYPGEGPEQKREEKKHNKKKKQKEGKRKKK